MRLSRTASGRLLTLISRMNGIDASQTIRPVGHESEPLPAPPKTKTQRAEGYGVSPFPTIGLTENASMS